MRYDLFIVLLMSLSLFVACGEDDSSSDGSEAGTETAGAEEAGAEEAGTEAAGTETAGTETAGTEAAGTETAGTETAGTEEAGTETAGTEEAGTETAGTEEAGTETAGTEEAGTETAGTEEAGTEIAGTEMAGTEMAGTEMFEGPGNGAHAFTMRNIDGEMIDMRAYRGKVLLIVNVASQCGYTRQYEGLQELYTQYEEQGLVVLGFPSDDFNQELDSEEEIKDFCTSRFSVTFPMFARVNVTGMEIDPLYGYLTSTTGENVAWNFNKFLVDAEGNVQHYYGSRVEPDSQDLLNDINELLQSATP